MMLSDVEGGPVTVAEAMASKCLVFSTNIGLSKDIIQDKQNGVLINNVDYEGIIDKIFYYYNNSELRRSIIENGYDFARNNMTYDKTFEPLRYLYREVISTIERFNYMKIDINSINSKNLKYAGKID
jgi:glycosyltransferase involved in cell wall biosynthesis